MYVAIATINDNEEGEKKTDVIVKFAESYGEAAHTFMAERIDGGRGCSCYSFKTQLQLIECGIGKLGSKNGRYVPLVFRPTHRCVY